MLDFAMQRELGQRISPLPAEGRPLGTQPLVLYVDDDFVNLRTFEANFGRDFNVLTVGQPEEALEVLRTRGQEVAVVLADERMPGMTGAELLEQAAELVPDARRIVVTGYSDTEAVMRAVNGARVSRYYYKPWDRDSLRRALTDAIEAFENSRQMRRLHTDLHRMERAAVVAVVADHVGQQLTQPLMAADLSTCLVDQQLAILSDKLSARSHASQDTELDELLSEVRAAMADARTAIQDTQQIAKRFRSRRPRLWGEGRAQLRGAALLVAGFFAANAAEARVRVFVDGPDVDLPGPLSVWVELLRDLVLCVARAASPHLGGPVVHISWKLPSDPLEIIVESGAEEPIAPQAGSLGDLRHADADEEDLDLAVASGLVGAVGGELLVGHRPGITQPFFCIRVCTW